MKILIIRFCVSISILSIVVYFCLSSVKYDDVYIVKYDTYEYNPDNCKQDLKRKDCEFTLKALSDKDASDKLVEMEHLNYLCVSDSIAIKQIIKY